MVPNNAKVHYNTAILRTQQMNYEEALVHLDKAQEIWKDYCEAESQRAIILWKMEKQEEAILFFKKGVSCKFTQVICVENLFKIYNELIKVFPSAYHYWKEWAEILENIGKYEEAVQHYLKCGIGYKDSDNNKKALSCFEKGVNCSKKTGAGIHYSTLHYWMGDLYSRMNKTLLAIEHFIAATGIIILKFEIINDRC